jgi:hypothetical protein
MGRVLSWVVAVVRFIYRFIVGDDLTVAVVMIATLAVTGVLAANRLSAWWLVPVLAIAMTGVSLFRSRRA